VGLHSGAPVAMRLLPAPAGSGIVFRRTDLDNFEISRHRPLRGQGELRHQLDAPGRADSDHRASALGAHRHGRGQRDCGAGQPGAAHPGRQRPALCRGFLECGHPRPAPPPRDHPRAASEIEVREGNKFIGIYPGSGYSIEYAIDFPAPSATRAPAWIWRPRPMASPLPRRAPSATRLTKRSLRDMGLIRGAGPENAIILDAQPAR
jgi:UDP-3-O-[3-hydroxymyristoyl] N-acetylglucosamine deacetylase